VDATGETRRNPVPDWENPQGDSIERSSYPAWPGYRRDLDVPAGWEPVAELCRRVGERADAVVDAMVARVREEVPVYRPSVAVPDEELRASVRGNLEMMLAGAAERRGPSPQELELCRQLGTHRAEEGVVPVNALLEAFVVGYRELWDEVVRESRAEPAEVRDLLFEAAATLWEWVHEVTDAVGTAFHERVRRSAALMSSIRERFFEGLLGGIRDEDELRGLAASLSFDSESSFCAIAITEAHGNTELLHGINGRLAAVAGHQHAVSRVGTLLVLDQGGRREELVSALREVIGDAAVGFGAPRVGLNGAALSIGDAERALAVALRGEGVADFARDWHAATVVASERRLAGLLEPGITHARQSPELARTIEAFAGSGFSMSKAARSLHVHTNTVAYRLNRWAELTGWDPRTHDGLLRSTSALALLDRRG
jgi:PucR C-terminal helix-turn-helix domain/GGDEF-like domain